MVERGVEQRLLPSGGVFETLWLDEHRRELCWCVDFGANFVEVFASARSSRRHCYQCTNACRSSFRDFYLTRAKNIQT